MLPILNSAEQNYAIFSHILKIIQGFVFNLKKNLWRLNFWRILLLLDCIIYTWEYLKLKVPQIHSSKSQVFFVDAHFYAQRFTKFQFIAVNLWSSINAQKRKSSIIYGK